MGVIVERFLAAGIRLTLAGDDALDATGPLTDEFRQDIRANKSSIIAELRWRKATPEQAEELRRLIQAVLRDAPEEYEETLAAALADPEAALESFRLLARAADVTGLTATAASNDSRRTCLQCRNYHVGQRQCLAAFRGENVWNAPRIYHPVPNQPQMCWSYLPGPDDPDRRSGRERWPNLFGEQRNTP